MPALPIWNSLPLLFGILCPYYLEFSAPTIWNTLPLTLRLTT